MKTLYVTTTTPYSMFDSGEDASFRTDIDAFAEKHKLEVTNVEYVQDDMLIYFHADAEDTAGFDIPTFLSGDIKQLLQPVNEQQIKLVLDDKEHNVYCVRGHKTNDHNFNNKKAYYLVFKKDVKNYNSEDS